MTYEQDLETWVRECFVELLQDEQITHGLDMKLFCPDGLVYREQFVYPVRSSSGGVALSFLCYIRAKLPEVYGGIVISNVVALNYQESRQSVLGKLAIEMARLVGFAEGLRNGKHQPRIAVEGEDLGLPWKSERGQAGTYGGFKREDYPEIKTAPKDSAGKSVADVFRKDFERKHPIRDVVAETQALVDANNIKVAEGAGLEVSLDGGKTFVSVQAGTISQCDCGAKDGELHFQFCQARISQSGGSNVSAS